MAGYFTQKRKDVELSQQVTLQVGTAPPSKTRPIAYSNHEVYSYRSGPQYDEEELSSNQAVRRLVKPEYRIGYDAAFDSGHPFQVDHQSLGLSHRDFYVKNGFSGSALRVARGPLLLDGIGIGSYPTIPSFTDSSVIGNRLIQAAAPLRSVASLSQALIEIKRDGLPSLLGETFLSNLRDTAKRRYYSSPRKSRKRQFSDIEGTSINSVGGEALNITFGAIPIISDLVNVLQAVTSVSQIVQQLNADSGSIIRRGRGIPKRITTAESTLPNRAVLKMQYNGSDIGGTSWATCYSGGTYASGRESRVVKTTRSIEQIWFKGAYTYYLHQGQTWADKMIRYEQYAQKLLGTRITPSVLYETTPWTWLSDWFVDFGTLLGIADDMQYDGSILRYGYLMRHTRVDDIYSASDFSFWGGGPGTVVNQFSAERRERIRATPFGFGLNPSVDFVDRQWAVLGWLGMTKAPNKLRIE